jgi:hypothetical protein
MVHTHVIVSIIIIKVSHCMTHIIRMQTLISLMYVLTFIFTEPDPLIHAHVRVLKGHAHVRVVKGLAQREYTRIIKLKFYFKGTYLHWI